MERFFVNKVAGEIRDLVHDTFAALVENRDRIDDPARFRSYLFSVAFNVLRTHLRDKYRRAERIEPDLNVSSAHDLAPGPITALGAFEQQRLLLEALRRVPMTDQTLLELYYWEDLSTADIGAVLGIPRGTVKSRLKAARGRLETAMAEIAASAEVLASTLSDLEAWARRCRDALGRDDIGGRLAGRDLGNSGGGGVDGAVRPD